MIVAVAGSADRKVPDCMLSVTVPAAVVGPVPHAMLLLSDEEPEQLNLRVVDQDTAHQHTSDLAVAAPSAVNSQVRPCRHNREMSEIINDCIIVGLHKLFFDWRRRHCANDHSGD